MEQKTEEVLKQGTLECPCCNSRLHFKQIHGIRLIENGHYEAKCPTKGTYYLIKAPNT